MKSAKERLPSQQGKKETRLWTGDTFKETAPFSQWEIGAAGSYLRCEDQHDAVLCTGNCYQRQYWCPTAALASSWWLNTIKHCPQAARLCPGMRYLCLTCCCAVYMYCLLSPAACCILSAALPSHETRLPWERREGTSFEWGHVYQILGLKSIMITDSLTLVSWRYLVHN